MARYISRFCTNKECIRFGETYNGELVKASHEVVGHSGANYMAKCTSCGNVQETPKPSDRHAQLKYPQYNASTGQTFDSRSDEKAYAKKNGLEGV